MLQIKKIGNGQSLQYGNYADSETVTPHATDWTQVDIIDAIQIQILSNASYTWAKSPADTGYTTSLPTNLDTAQMDYIYIKGTADITILKNIGAKSPVDFFVISGTVTDDSSVAIEGATVTFADVDNSQVDYTATTDADGAFSITLYASRYDVTASKTGYTPETQNNVDIRTGSQALTFALVAV